MDASKASATFPLLLLPRELVLHILLFLSSPVRLLLLLLRTGCLNLVCATTLAEAKLLLWTTARGRGDRAYVHGATQRRSWE